MQTCTPTDVHTGLGARDSLDMTASSATSTVDPAVLSLWLWWWLSSWHSSLTQLPSSLERCQCGVWQWGSGGPFSRGEDSGLLFWTAGEHIPAFLHEPCFVVSSAKSHLPLPEEQVKPCVPGKTHLLESQELHVHLCPAV